MSSTTQTIEGQDNNSSNNRPCNQSYTIPSGHDARLTASSPTSWRTLVLGVDSWLRYLGFFGSYSVSNFSFDQRKTKIVFGYNLPSWLSGKTFYLDLRYVSGVARDLDLKILPGRIRVQNRVPLDCSFMQACKRGDLPLIEQHVRDKTGSVHDRTICAGATPLLVGA